MREAGAPSVLDLEVVFRNHWLDRLNKILPLPTLAFGGCMAWYGVRPVETAGAVLVYVVFNTTLSKAIFRWPWLDTGNHLRALGNATTLGVAGYASGQWGWLLALTTVFGGLFAVGRLSSLYLRSATGAGALIGSWLGGATAADLVPAGVVLVGLSYLASRLHEPLRATFIAHQLQELELEEKNRVLSRTLDARQEFVASMSHEIRTPLNGVLGMAELLEHTELDREQRSMLAVVRDAGQGLLGTINDVLDLAKLDAGRMELDPRPFAPAHLAERVRALLATTVDAEKVQIELRTEGLPATVRSDPVRLRQILLNLVGNAAKFTPEGRIEITMGWADDRLHVEVADTGIGISPERLSTLFLPFEQADVSIQRRFGGTGLGLAISHRLVSLLGGELWAKSAPLEGSTFGFTISAPRVEVEVEAPPESLEGLRPARVLVVDDNPVNLKVAEAMLRRLDCSVTLASSGAQALEAAGAADFDIVLMDCRMPEMDGMQATEQLRARGFRVPILALTAGVTPAERAQCMQAGMDDVVAKPVSMQTLRTQLHRWAHAPDAEQAAAYTKSGGAAFR